MQLSDKYDNLEREFNILKVRVQHFLIQSCAILLTQIKKCKNPPSFVLTLLLRLYLFFSVGVVQFHREQAVWCSVRGRGTKQVRSVRNTASHHVSGFLMMAVCWWCSVLGVNIHMCMYLYNLCIAGQYQSWNWKIKDLAEKTTTSDIS